MDSYNAFYKDFRQCLGLFEVKVNDAVKDLACALKSVK